MKKTRLSILACTLLVTLAGVSQAQLRLPDPTEALSSPGMEKMAGILFSRRLESGMLGQVDLLPPEAVETKRVQRIVGKLAQAVAMDRPNVVYQAKVIRSNEVNAFCIPGGYIYVYTGLIDHIDKNHQENPDDALAAVLGHEIAHAVLRHGLKEWATSREYQDILKDPELFRNVLMANSRAQEFEADRYGALYALRSGFAMTAAADVFDKFPRSRAIYDRGLADHPTGEERVAQLNKFEKQMATTIGMWDESLKAGAAGRYDQASVALEILEAEFPNLPSIHNNLGWVYYRVYEKTDPTPMKEHPSYSYVDQLGVKVRSADGDVVILNEAADEFNKALQLNPDMVEAYEGSALCALESGDLDKAAQVLKKAEPLAANRPQLRNLQGILAARQGNMQQASNHYQDALKGDPKFAPALFNLAVAQAGLGLAKESQENFQKFLALEPEGHWATVARQGKPVTVAMAGTKEKVQGLGPVNLGDSEDAVIKALGQPTASSETATQMRKMEFTKQGLVVWLDGNKVRMVSSSKLSPDKAPVKIGDSRDQLEKTLGKPIQSQPADGGNTVLSYPGQGMSLLLRDDKVSEITIANP